MKLSAKLLILLALFGGTAIVGCGPKANPQNASGEKEVFDEDAYAKEWDAEQKRSAAELSKE